MKHLLITGTGERGFIGKNLVEGLSGKYNIFAPRSSELDICDFESVKKYIEVNHISFVIHSATYNGVRRQVNPEDELRANLVMFYNLVALADKFEKLIYFGSGAEFDKRYEMRSVKEEEVGRSIPIHNHYSLSKYIMNQEARQSKNIYNLRLFGVYGKYEDWQTCFISNLCCKAAYGLPLTIRQECLFDFLYIDDLVQVVEWFLENEPRYHDYNICTGREEKLSEIAQCVKKIAGKPLEVIRLKEGQNLAYTGNPKRMIEEYLDFKPRSLAEGIQLLYQYYIEHLSEIDREILKVTK